jgi:FKBP-type peptidyl-prolyl cis-trans isomerase
MNQTFTSAPLALALVLVAMPILAQAPGFKKLQIKDIKPGKGYAAKNADSVEVLYIGSFKDGKVFDANMDKHYKATKASFTVTLGQHMVISGWDKGLIGAKEGMVRKLNIPWSMAYGAAGRSPVIPAKSDLVFTVKVLKITKG